ncbi:MAG: thiamine-phosphate kinase, partial [Chthoniobacterales bacterium]
MNLRERGEDRLIADWIAHLQTRPDVIVGPGDDCAVVRVLGAKNLLLLKTDCVVEGVHFRPNESPSAVGRKAMARTLSDFAAMSGLPQWALITLIAPANLEADWSRQLYRGIKRIADRFEVAIVGGETSSTKGPAVVSVSAVGTVEKDRCISRSGGKVGDALYVTGKLGDSLRKRHLTFIPRIAEARWLTGNFQLHALMDLSDGLGADLPRLAKASKVGFEIDEKALPRSRGCSVEQAINDGEDYELLFALSPNDSEALEKNWRKKFSRLPVTRIGSLIPHYAFRVPHFFRGYVHFT